MTFIEEKVQFGEKRPPPIKNSGYGPVTSATPLSLVLVFGVSHSVTGKIKELSQLCWERAVFTHIAPIIDWLTTHAGFFFKQLSVSSTKVMLLLLIEEVPLVKVVIVLHRPISFLTV